MSYFISAFAAIDVHPIFKNTPDLEAASAFSEYFTQSPYFKVSTEVDTPDFPPEPSTIVALQLAYRDTAVLPEITRRKLYLPDIPANMDVRVIDELLTRYDQRVGIAHRVLGRSDEPSFEALVQTNVKDPAVELAKRMKLRTVAGFILFQSVDLQRFYDGIYIPTKTYEELPLIFRHSVTALIKDLGAQSQTMEELAPGSKDLFQEVLQNGPASREMAFHGAALNLPSTDILANYFAMEKEFNQKPIPQPALNRAQRRAAQKRKDGYK